MYLTVVSLCPVKRLAVCEELDKSCCGNLLFFCQLFPPVFDPLTLGTTPPISVPQFQLTPGTKTGELYLMYHCVYV